MKGIVSVDWLNENLKKENLVILDASPDTTIDGSVSPHEGVTIPGSRKFDLKNDFSDAASPFPNTVPGTEQFEKNCQKLGINSNSLVVVYDNLGIYTSPRVWWLFQLMGHEAVYVLDGGLPQWIQEGYQTEKGHLQNPDQGNFKAKPQNGYLKTYEDILENNQDCAFTIVDVRSKGRFEGTAPEPREGLESGHMPNSLNIPYQEVLSDGKFKSREALYELFSGTTPLGGKLVFSCGSGLTACIVMLAREISYGDSRMVYDGSWTEWAEKQNLKE